MNAESHPIHEAAVALLRFGLGLEWQDVCHLWTPSSVSRFLREFPDRPQASMAQLRTVLSLLDNKCHVKVAGIEPCPPPPLEHGSPDGRLIVARDHRRAILEIVWRRNTLAQHAELLEKHIGEAIESWKPFGWHSVDWSMHWPQLGPIIVPDDQLAKNEPRRPLDTDLEQLLESFAEGFLAKRHGATPGRTWLSVELERDAVSLEPETVPVTDEQFQFFLINRDASNLCWRFESRQDGATWSEFTLTALAETEFLELLVQTEADSDPARLEWKIDGTAIGSQRPDVDFPEIHRFELTCKPATQVMLRCEWPATMNNPGVHVSANPTVFQTAARVGEVGYQSAYVSEVPIGAEAFVNPLRERSRIRGIHQPLPLLPGSPREELSVFFSRAGTVLQRRATGCAQAERLIQGRFADEVAAASCVDDAWLHTGTPEVTQGLLISVRPREGANGGARSRLRHRIHRYIEDALPAGKPFDVQVEEVCHVVSNG